MIKIFIVDDHTIMRQGLKHILADTDDIVVVGEAASGSEGIKEILATPCDIVLLDIKLPDRDGLSVLQVLKQDKPSLPVLMLSTHPEKQFAVRCLQSGAAGYLTKESASAELIDAIRRVAQGGRYVTLSLAETLAFTFGAESQQAPHEQLSDREFQVVRMIGQGRATKEIALYLSLSPKTVSTYRSRILQKLNLNSNAEIVRYAVEHNLID